MNPVILPKNLPIEQLLIWLDFEKQSVYIHFEPPQKMDSVHIGNISILNNGVVEPCSPTVRSENLATYYHGENGFECHILLENQGLLERLKCSNRI